MDRDLLVSAPWTVTTTTMIITIIEIPFPTIVKTQRLFSRLDEHSERLAHFFLRDSLVYRVSSSD